MLLTYWQAFSEQKLADQLSIEENEKALCQKEVLSLHSSLKGKDAEILAANAAIESHMANLTLKDESIGRLANECAALKLRLVRMHDAQPTSQESSAKKELTKADSGIQLAESATNRIKPQAPALYSDKVGPAPKWVSLSHHAYLIVP